MFYETLNENDRNNNQKIIWAVQKNKIKYTESKIAHQI